MLRHELFEYAVILTPLIMQLFAWARRGNTFPSRVPTLIASTALAFLSLGVLIAMASIPCPDIPPPCPSVTSNFPLLPAITYSNGCNVCLPPHEAGEFNSGLALNQFRSTFALFAGALALVSNVALLASFITWAKQFRAPANQ